MIRTISLPPLLGHTDEQAQAYLDQQREQALAWMRAHQLPVLAETWSPAERVHPKTAERAALLPSVIDPERGP